MITHLAAPRAFGIRVGLRILLLISATLLTGLSVSAQSTGTISGRVFNPGNRQYVRNVDVSIPGTNLTATSGDDGYYTIHNVPPGSTTVVATYPGAAPVTHTVTVTAGSAAMQDFEISLGRDDRKDEAVVLQAFTVEGTREGQAKMIAEQKQAANIKQVVSTDVFGDMTEQNIGEFLKYLPGVTIDYVETDTRTASLGGMDPKYGYVTLDGNAQASGDSGSFGSNTRQFEFESISMNNIESVEINKTLTPDMWADAPAGTINLRTRSALDAKNQRYSVTAGFVWNSKEPDFKKTSRHDDDTHAKIRPRLSFDYSSGALFNNKFGYSLNGSFTNIYKVQFRESITYNYSRGMNDPFVTSIGFKDGPKLVEKSSGGLKMDFRPIRQLKLTTAGSYTYFDDFFANRNLTFNVGNPTNSGSGPFDLAAGSNATTIIALPSAAGTQVGRQTRIDQTGESTGKKKDNTNASFIAEYKQGSWSGVLSLLYSRARERRGGMVYGTVGNTPVRLRTIGFTAVRPDVKSTDWHIVQTSGPSWTDWNNWVVDDDLNTNRQLGKTEQYTGKADIKKVMPWRIPTTYQFGVGNNVTFKHRKVEESFVGRYTAPAGEPRMPLSPATFEIVDGFGGNVPVFPVVHKEALDALRRTNPERFVQSEANLAAQINNVRGSFQSNQEDIRAAYLMQSSRVGTRWMLLGGVRMENTRTITSVPGEVPIPDNPFRTTAIVNGQPVPRAVNTVAYANYRWSLPKENLWGRYTDYMPSAMLKYTITPNLFLKAGWNKSIKRPDLNRTAGPLEVTFNETTGDTAIVVPNPALKPERANRFSLFLDYYFGKTGNSNASIHVYQSNLKNPIDDNEEGVDAATAGFGGTEIDRPEFRFFTFFNAEEKRTVKGIELAYTQQLDFLESKWLNGTTLFATYSHRTAVQRPRTGTRFIPRVATAGATWGLGKFRLSVNGTWTDYTFVGATTGAPGQPEYFKPRTIIFVDARYKITRNFSVFVSGDRAYDSGKIWMYKSDGRVRQIEEYGQQWSVGFRGEF